MKLWPLAITGLLLAACVGDPAAHLEQARALTFRRQPREALKQYEEVLSLLAKKDPQRVRPVLAAALKGAGDLCYLELRLYPQAIEYYRSLANHFPDAEETLEARSSLSDLYRRLGDRRAAVAELTALVHAFPEGADVDRYQYQAIKDYFDLGDYNQVIVEARVLQQRYPASRYAVEAQMMVAEALALQGQRTRAIEAFGLLTRRWPEHELAPQAQVEQAKIWAELGDEARAVEVLVEALKAHPNPKGVQAEIARLRKRLALHRAGDRFGAWHEPHPAHGMRQAY